MAIINGTTGPDTLVGTVDDDVINGLSGNDTIDGGDGNDLIFGGSGVDNLSGGNGNDTFVEDTVSSAGEVFNGGAGTDTIQLEVLVGSPAPFPTSIGLLSPHSFTSATLTSIERIVFGSQVGHTVQGVLNLSTWASIGLTDHWQRRAGRSYPGGRNHRGHLHHARSAFEQLGPCCAQCVGSRGFRDACGWLCCRDQFDAERLGRCDVYADAQRRGG
jgi:hypothetical protein